MSTPHDPGVQAWLLRLRADVRQPAQQPRRALWVAGHEIGSLQDSLARQLPHEALQAHGVALQGRAQGWHLSGEGDATQQLDALARVLRATGHCGPWRDEQLAVCNLQGRRIATVERGAVRPLGIATQAVHLVGEAPDGRVWVQQRARDKPTNPGMWDTLMGGMVAARDTVAEAVERETWEEAGLRVAELQGMRHGGHVLFERPSDEAEGRGFMRERIDWFSATVPDGLRPDNQDGEVQAFALMERGQLIEWLLQDRFTPEAAQVLAAWLGW
ncbi:NUDIX hydrolase YfcD [Delftia tsuruhatensis]|uniref:NUDIX hydrolase n=1 Tax=Delftia tsuruhatensis TaxID=180282 RepID=UPI001E6BB8CC|nr:NUDIX domain-containing protein [Delftia tsuruhatensis]CAB5695592.1 NUDIX hydrolase YfcD [Delftia tsuruhatensis]CAC9678213.1 NUDIX hydrolase YfcD [Delftia tsuruhatensis]